MLLERHNTVSTSVLGDTDLGYAGMFHHVDSGLYLTQYRVYAPIAGRWLSRDRSARAAILPHGIGVGTYNNTTGYVLSLNYMTDSSP